MILEYVARYIVELIVLQSKSRVIGMARPQPALQRSIEPGFGEACVLARLAALWLAQHLSSARLFVGALTVLRHGGVHRNCKLPSMSYASSPHALAQELCTSLPTLRCSCIHGAARERISLYGRRINIF